MSYMIDEATKNKAVENMTKSIVALRTMMGVTQEELADLIGVTRQTMYAYESKKRTMPWNIYLALLFVFENCETVCPLLKALEIYPDGLYSIFEQINKRNTEK